MLISKHNSVLIRVFYNIGNIFFSIIYITLVGGILLSPSSKPYWLLKGILCLFLITQTYGHILKKNWALKNTVVVLVLINILLLLFLFPMKYEYGIDGLESLPSFQEQLLKFFQFTILTTISLLLYWISCSHHK